MKQITINAVLDILNSIATVSEIPPEQLDIRLSDYGIDSLEYVRVLVMFEEMFDCEVPDSMINLSEYDTPRKLIEALQKIYAQRSSDECRNKVEKDCGADE